MQAVTIYKHMTQTHIKKAYIKNFCEQYNAAIEQARAEYKASSLSDRVFSSV